jgi:hypothetical protein
LLNLICLVFLFETVYDTNICLTYFFSVSAIERRLKRGDGGDGGVDPDDDRDDAGPEAFLNSRMSLGVSKTHISKLILSFTGRRKKPKRQFIMPALRQAAPIDSRFVEPVNECQWKCKLCEQDILAAVISAGAIRHYRAQHPEHLDAMQSVLFLLTNFLK